MITISPNVKIEFKLNEKYFQIVSSRINEYVIRPLGLVAEETVQARLSGIHVKNDKEDKIYRTNTLLQAVKTIHILSPVKIISSYKKIHLPYLESQKEKQNVQLFAVGGSSMYK